MAEHTGLLQLMAVAGWGSSCNLTVPNQYVNLVNFYVLEIVADGAKVSSASTGVSLAYLHPSEAGSPKISW